MKRSLIDFGMITVAVILPVIATFHFNVEKEALVGLAAVIVGTMLTIHRSQLPRTSTSGGYLMLLLTSTLFGVMFYTGSFSSFTFPVPLDVLILVSIIIGIISGFLTERVSILGTLPILTLVFSSMNTSFNYTNPYAVPLTTATLIIYALTLVCWGASKIFIRLRGEV